MIPQAYPLVVEQQQDGWKYPRHFLVIGWFPRGQRPIPVTVPFVASDCTDERHARGQPF
jgi:hypothetical protein